MFKILYHKEKQRAKCYEGKGYHLETLRIDYESTKESSGKDLKKRYCKRRRKFNEEISGRLYFRPIPD